jgi:hypothetical protein
MLEGEEKLKKLEEDRLSKSLEIEKTCFIKN